MNEEPTLRQNLLSEDVVCGNVEESYRFEFKMLASVSTNIRGRFVRLHKHVRRFDAHQRRKLNRLSHACINNPDFLLGPTFGKSKMRLDFGFKFRIARSTGLQTEVEYVSANKCRGEFPDRDDTQNRLVFLQGSPD